MKPLHIRSLTSTKGFIFITGLYAVLIILYITLNFIQSKPVNSPLILLLIIYLFQYWIYAKAYFKTKKIDKPQLILKDESLIIFETEIKLEDIHRIIVRGYFNTSYSIQLKNHKFIKPLHQFKFAAGQIQHEDAFNKWAKEHNLKLGAGFALGVL